MGPEKDQHDMSQETKDKFFNFLLTLKPSLSSSGIYLRLVILIALSFFSQTNVYFETLGKIALVPVAMYLAIMYFSLDIFFKVSSLFIIYIYKKKNKLSEKRVDNFTLGITRLSSFIFIAVFLLVFTDTVIISIKTILTSVTIVIAFVGLAFRDYITNFFNGISIMFSGKFQLGEYVKIGTNKGRIQDITFTHVQLLTEQKDVIYVPNNLVLSTEVINYSKSQIKNIIIPVMLEKNRFTYHKDLPKYIISQVYKKFSEVIASKDDIKINVDVLEKDYLKWTIEYVVLRYDFELERDIKNFTADTILEFLNKKDKEEEKKKAEVAAE